MPMEKVEIQRYEHDSQGSNHHVCYLALKVLGPKTLQLPVGGGCCTEHFEPADVYTTILNGKTYLLRENNHDGHVHSRNAQGEWVIYLPNDVRLPSESALQKFLDSLSPNQQRMFDRLDLMKKE